MATATAEDVGLIKYPVTDQQLAQIRDEYLPLVVAGPTDEKGYKRVYAAHQEVKGILTDVEKTRKGLKAASLEYGRKVDAAAKRITGELEVVESHLAGQRKIVDDEKARVQREALERERLAVEAAEKARKDAEEAKLQAERDRLAAEAARLAEIERQQQEAARLKREADEREWQAERAKFEAEKAAEEAKQRAERDTLEAMVLAMREAQAKIDAENKRIADEEAARRHAEEMKVLQAKAAEEARIATEARLKREAEEAEAKRVEDERLAKEDAARVEAMRPDMEKVKAFGRKVTDLSASCPTVESRSALDAIQSACRQLESISKSLFSFTA